MPPVRDACVNSALAQDFNGGEDLGALGMVRMVYLGFRALKTPETSSLPTLTASAAV